MVLCQRRKPERELGEVNCHGVFVDSVQTALGDEAASVEDLVLVRWDVLRHALVGVPGPHQQFGRPRQAATRNAPGPWPGRKREVDESCSGVGVASDYDPRLRSTKRGRVSVGLSRVSAGRKRVSARR